MNFTFKANAKQALTIATALACFSAGATEGGLGRPVSGTTVQANGGIVLPEPSWVVNFSEIYRLQRHLALRGDAGVLNSRQSPRNSFPLVALQE